MALDRGGLYPEGLAFERTARKDLEEVTVADLNTLARRTVDPARAREFRYLPEE